MSQVHPPSGRQQSMSDSGAGGKGRGRWLADLLVTGLRRALYPLFALPVGLVALVLVFFGRAPAAGALHRWLARRLLDVSVPAPARAATAAYSWVSLPINLVGFVPAAYLWALVPANVGYPLRPDTTAESLETAWGGPSLVGAWVVHALGGTAVFLLVGLPVLSTIAWFQGRLARRMLGRNQPATQE